MVQYCCLVQPLLFLLLFTQATSLTGEALFWFIALHAPFACGWGILVFTSISDIDRDRMVGTFAYLKITPLGYVAILLSRTLVNTMLAYLSGILLLAVGLGGGVIALPVMNGFPWLVLGWWTLVWLLVGWFSLLLAVFITKYDEGRILMNFVNFPIVIVSAFGFSSFYLPDALAWLSVVFPHALLLELLRERVGLVSVLDKLDVAVLPVFVMSSVMMLVATVYFLRKSIHELN
ncbi:hypothetical protein VITU9109_08852 [Vibrio tubiashii ATCC 19109]|nr:hypothetical protein VITU9109_08852 [Vibrio tubiashii ATCC 19109]